MTNKELQDLLKQYPDDMPVYVENPEMSLPFEVVTVSRRHLRIKDENGEDIGHNYVEIAGDYELTHLPPCGIATRPGSKETLKKL